MSVLQTFTDEYNNRTFTVDTGDILENTYGYKSGTMFTTDLGQGRFKLLGVDDGATYFELLDLPIEYIPPRKYGCWMHLGKHDNFVKHFTVEEENRPE